MLFYIYEKSDGRKLEHATGGHLRIMAVRRVMEDGEKPSRVMQSMGLCRTSIHPWLRAFKTRGLEGLRSSKSPGTGSKLTPKQREAVRRWIVGKDPRQYGSGFGLWTRQAVADLIRGRFGVALCLGTAGNILAGLGITPQKPLRRVYGRDPAAAGAWKAKTYPKLRARARKHGAEIYFPGEAGFSSEPNLGRTCGRKGATPVVRTSGQRQKVNAISAVNARGGFWSTVYTGNMNPERFITFLEAFMRRRGKVFLVVDGHHRSKRARDFVRATRGRLELHFLPPYAPDLNPDEFVWHYAKRNGCAKRPLRQNESLRERVESDLLVIQNDKPLIRSFFRAKRVVYTID